jgi:uncharacterized protein (TIGR03435 family)
VSPQLIKRSLEAWKKLFASTLGIAATSILLSIGLTHPPAMRAQSPPTTAQMRFEVASVKFSADQDVLEARPRRTVGRFRWKTQLIYLLGYAYHMEWWRISEKPASGSVSLDSIYQIEATTDPDTTEDQERLMLQALLIERFKMIAHRETKGAVQGYALTVAKDGPRMEAVKEEKASDDPTISDGWVTAHGQSQDVIIEGHRATMLQVTETLQRLLNTSALDQTGLAGKYNFRIEFERGDDPSDYTAVVAAVRQLGLKLEKYKGPVEFLVIDHLDKLVEN